MSGRNFRVPSTGAPQEVDKSVVQVHMDPSTMIPIYNPQVPPPNFTVQGPPAVLVQVQHPETMAPPPPPGVPLQVQLPETMAPPPPGFLPARVAMAPTPSLTNIPPPTTLASRPISHSEGYMQTLQQMPQVMQHSVPFLGSSTKKITLQDDFGNERTIFVTDQTMQNVRAVIQAGEQNLPTPAAGLYAQRLPSAPSSTLQSSMGSLPSAHSYYGSTSSFGSNFSQQSGANPVAVSLDPASAIREQCQLLMQAGRTHELNQILHEMGLTVPQQQLAPQYQPGVVHYAGGEVSNFEVQTDVNEDDEQLSSRTNIVDIVNSADNENTEYPKFGETSSAENIIVQGKPKKGVRRIFTTVLSRLFTSKL